MSDGGARPAPDAAAAHGSRGYARLRAALVVCAGIVGGAAAGMLPAIIERKTLLAPDPDAGLGDLGPALLALFLGGLGALAGASIGLTVAVLRLRAGKAASLETFADRWHATPTSLQICGVVQWIDAVAAGCAFVYLVTIGVRGLGVAAPWRTTAPSHIDVFALAIASVVALLFAVVAGAIAALAYWCGSGLLRGRSRAWEFSVYWLGVAAVVVAFLRLDLLLLLVICVQLATLCMSGARRHLHPDPRAVRRPAHEAPES